MFFRIFVAVTLLLLSFSASAQLTLTFEQATPTEYRLETVGGTLDIAGLPPTGNQTFTPQIDYASPTNYDYILGAPSTGAQFESYQVAWTPENNFQSGPVVTPPALNSGGGIFGFASLTDTVGLLLVPPGSGGTIGLGFSTFPGTLSDLNLSVDPVVFSYAGGGSTGTVELAVADNSKDFVGGTATGLTGTLGLQNNGGDDVPVPPGVGGSSTFRFPTQLVYGDPYAVTVASQPPGQSCSVANGSGTMADAEITSVQITCVDDPTPNRAPTVLDDLIKIPVGTPSLTIAAPGALSGAIDPDGDALTAALVVDAADGTVFLDPDGSFTYTRANPNTPGSDSFQYRANDGTTDSNTAEITIFVTDVNVAPVANPDAYSMAQDTLLVVPVLQSVLANDRDPEGHALTAAKASDPSNGTLQSFADTGVFLYRPNPGFTGSDSFTYTASDGSLSSPPATVSITVNPNQNRPPIIANDDAYTMSQGDTLNVFLPGLLGNDSDLQGHPLTAAISSVPTVGGVTVNPDGSFTYTPPPTFSGVDTFTYVASDGATTSAAATVQITVTAVANQPPVANNDTYATPLDTDLVVASPGVLGNDIDPEGSALRISSIVTQPANGVLAPRLLGGFKYTPTTGFTGTVSFQYRASDNQSDSNIATAQITVSPTNQPPVANNNTYTVIEDKVLFADDFLANDTDPEGHVLTAIKVSDPANGTIFGFDKNGSFTYKPNAGFVGTDSFTYTASDGAGSSNTATITIRVTAAAANGPPVTSNDAYSVVQGTVLNVTGPGILGNDSDPEGHALTAAVSFGGQPTNGHLSLSPDGSFSYTPDSGFVGVDSFAYVARDDAAQSTAASVQITVTAATANLPPVVNNDAYATPQGTVLNVAAPGVLANDADPEGHALTVTVTSQPTNGTLAKNPNGGFSYTPTLLGFSGTDSYTYTASDGALDSNVATVQLTVTAAASNLPPVANGDIYTTLQDTVLTVAAPGVLSNDSDPEGHALTVTVTSQPTNGTLAKNPNGGFSYVPNAGFIGTDTYTYTVSDGALDSNETSVSITVTRAPAVPVPALGWPALLLLLLMTAILGLHVVPSRVRM
ncbi:VCBS protein [Luminiphilus syltensis NOR5-1B]|uniref:VCBS protein n=1 Tax=Luminiphilus syltensis NOR5-1B TaxID=565045 RepID=B8KVM1_9GAMM|nr:cadherin-like domain-containing protein [Luminiphilus syltensis]EED34092.1 VCBS protein [Luminiphilus syltensis NOR5-1B]